MKTWPSLVLIFIGLVVVVWILFSVLRQPAPEKWVPEPLPSATPHVSSGPQPTPAPLPRLMEETPAPVDTATPPPAEPIVPPLPAETVPATPSPSPATTPLSPEVYLESVRTMIRDFRLQLLENPVGTNREITAALRGGNAGQIDFLANQPARINDSGELIDPWGTPLFFHQLSAEQMEVRSAGPDRRMWNEDDLIAK